MNGLIVVGAGAVGGFIGWWVGLAVCLEGRGMTELTSWGQDA
jgi:hypothetical protein